MSWFRKIQVVGLNHRTAPVEIRESLAFARTRLAEALSAARQMDGVEESVILSTCNRVEIYLYLHAIPGEDLARRFLASFHGLDVERFERCLYRREDLEAITHLFRVASGLDSMVLGEAQIAGQVRQAYEVASRENAAGPVLHRLFQRALSAAKRVRACSDIGAGRGSVASVAVQLAEQFFEGLAGRTVLLIGAGKMGKIVLRGLRAAGAQTTLVANRTLSRAEALARECGGSPVDFDQLAANLSRADIVISSTDSAQCVVRRPDIEEALRARRGRPIFIIDIAVPRDVDPAAAQVEGCHLYNVDDLQVVVEKTISRRTQEVARCLAIVDEESAKFMRWVHTLHVEPTIVELRDRVHELKRREMNALMSRLPDLPDATRLAIERMADRLVNKILHQPVEALRELASAEEPKDPLSVARRLFGVAEDAPPPASEP